MIEIPVIVGWAVGLYLDGWAGAGRGALTGMIFGLSYIGISVAVGIVRHDRRRRKRR